jgi:hypothetical protein
MRPLFTQERVAVSAERFVDGLLTRKIHDRLADVVQTVEMT